MSRRQSSTSGFALLDAREQPGLVDALRGGGCEINDTMVVQLHGRLYKGAEATRVVAEIARDTSAPRRAMLYAIGAASWSRWLYPWLVRGRRLLVRMRGRDLIP